MIITTKREINTAVSSWSWVAIYFIFELPQSRMHFFYILKVTKITWYSTSYLLTFSFDPYYMMHLLTRIKGDLIEKKTVENVKCTSKLTRTLELRNH